MADHADCNTTNNTSTNLHWVAPALDWFNQEQVSGSEFKIHQGVWHWSNQGPSTIWFQDVEQGKYNSSKTAAQVCDLLACLAFGSQLGKTPGLLNSPGWPGFLVKTQTDGLVKTQTDGVDIYCVDNAYIVIYNFNIKSAHKSLCLAEKAAKTLLQDMHNAWTEKEKRLEKLGEGLTVEHNNDSIAYFPIKVGQKETAEILLNNKVWRKLKAAGAVFQFLHG